MSKKSFHHHMADFFSFMPRLPFSYYGLPRNPRMLAPKDDYAASRQGYQYIKITSNLT